jgi:tryptophan synthase alpha chain
LSNLPVMVGFGIRTPEMAGNVAEVADGVVVASVLIDEFDLLRCTTSGKAFELAAGALVNEFRQAVARRTLAQVFRGRTS